MLLLKHRDAVSAYLLIFFNFTEPPSACAILPAHKRQVNVLEDESRAAGQAEGSPGAEHTSLGTWNTPLQEFVPLPVVAHLIDRASRVRRVGGRQSRGRVVDR